MQIEHIKTFLAVTICGSFVEAANSLYTTQATVSKRIMSLEKELDVQLFDRSRRTVALTETGELFLQYAERFLVLYNEMHASFDVQRIKQKSSLCVGAIPVMAQYGITAVITAFRKDNPNIQMTLDEREASDLLPALDHGQYEMVFLRSEGLVQSNRYQFFNVDSDRLTAVLPITHPLARNASVSLTALKDDDFLLLEKRTALLDMCMNACQQVGFTPHVVYSGTRIENIIDMVGQGMGISLLMEKPARFVSNKNVMLMPLEEAVTSYIALVRLRKSKPSHAAEMFWSHARNKRLIQRRV